jgi:hypothetical protein
VRLQNLRSSNPLYSRPRRFEFADGESDFGDGTPRDENILPAVAALQDNRAGTAWKIECGMTLCVSIYL